MQFTTDALVHDTDNLRIDTTDITLEVIIDIEKSLDLDEKVIGVYTKSMHR